MGYGYSSSLRRRRRIDRVYLWALYLASSTCGVGNRRRARSAHVVCSILASFWRCSYVYPILCSWPMLGLGPICLAGERSVHPNRVASL
jgi:hypothetical protein